MTKRMKRALLALSLTLTAILAIVGVWYLTAYLNTVFEFKTILMMVGFMWAVVLFNFIYKFLGKR